MKTKRTLSVLLVSAMILALAAGCTSGGTPPDTTTAGTTTTAATTKSPSTTSAATSATTAPPMAETPTISWLSRNSNYTGVDYTHGRVIEELQRLTGFHLDLELLDNATYADAMAPRLAAGTDLADVVCLPNNDTNMQYIKAGLFTEITDLYEQNSVYLKPFWENEYPQIKAQLTTPEGKLYYVSTVAMTNTLVRDLMVNELWLANLGLGWPETTEEFYDLLVAFKEQDANGNGDATDEIPLALVGLGALKGMSSFWGLNLDSRFAAVDGKVECSYTSQRYLDFLTYAKRLYDEGLLDAEFNSRNHDAVISLIANDTVGSTFQYAWHSSMRYAPKYAEYDGSAPVFSNIPPLEGPNGDRFYWEVNGAGTRFGITKFCKDPALAFQFLDMCYSDTIRELMYWGVEGIDYVVIDGVKYQTEFSAQETRDKPDSSGKAAVGFILVQDVATIYKADGMPQWHIDQDQALKQYFKSPILPVFALQEETDTLSMYATDMGTFFDENMIAFISGKRPLSDFDKYVEESKAFSVDKLTAVYEAQYQRFAAAIG